MEKECYLVINVIISCEGVNKKAVFFIKYEKDILKTHWKYIFCGFRCNIKKQINRKIIEECFNNPTPYCYSNDRLCNGLYRYKIENDQLVRMVKVFLALWLKVDIFDVELIKYDIRNVHL